MRYLSVFIAVSLIFSGCAIGSGSATFPPSANNQANPPMGANDDGADHRILVANGVSETISIIERNDGVWNSEQDAIATGQSPNQILIRDNFCYVVNSLSNSIQVINLNSYKTVREISTGAGTNPVNMDFIDEKLAAVTAYLTNELLIVDISENFAGNNRVLKKIQMPDGKSLPRDSDVQMNWARPGGLKIVDGAAYVACANLEFVHVAAGLGIIAEIDLKTFEISRLIELSGRDTISVIYSERYPDRLVFTSAGDYSISDGFIGNGTVESMDMNTGGIFQVIHVNGAPFDGAIGSDDLLYMENGMKGSVLKADLRTGMQMGSVALPGYGLSLSYASALLPLPGLILAANFNSDRIYIFDLESDENLVELSTGDGPDAIVLVF